MKQIEIDGVQILLTKKRIKNMYIRVSANRVKISAPLNVSDRHVFEFAAARMEWIKLHLQSSQPVCRETITKAQREELAILSRSLIEKWCAALDVKCNELRIRDMKTRWGSCNYSKKIVTLNAQLALRPQFLDYIILHELAHLIEPSHGEKFKAVLDRHMPDWRALRKQMK